MLTNVVSIVGSNVGRCVAFAPERAGVEGPEGQKYLAALAFENPAEKGAF